MKRPLLIALGFVVGTAVLVGSFFGALIFLELMNRMIIILPKTVVLDGTANFGAALASNALACAVFAKIAKSKGAQIAFSVWVIVLWALYLAACLLGGDYNLLVIPIVGIVLHGAVIATTFSDVKEAAQKEKENDPV